MLMVLISNVPQICGGHEHSRVNSISFREGASGARLRKDAQLHREMGSGTTTASLSLFTDLQNKRLTRF